MNENIQFNEPGHSFEQAPAPDEQSAISSMVLKSGLAKDAKQAQIVLVVLAVIAFVIMIFLWPKSGNGTIDAPIDPKTQVQAPNTPSAGQGNTNDTYPASSKNDELFNF